jgi:hypothetical protein
MSNIGFSIGDMIIYNGFWDVYDEEGLHDLDLAVLSKEKLRLLRNAIYARRGLIFKSGDLTMLFSRFDWYKPQYANVDDLLTERDKKYIKSIQAYENMVPNREITAEDLVGTWTGIWPLPSGPYYDIKVYPDGEIEFGYNSMRSQAVSPTKGTYRLENGFLVVLITEQRLRLGGYFSEGGSSFRYVDGDAMYATITYDNPIKAVFPIGKELYETYTTAYGDEYKVKNRVIGSGLKFKYHPYSGGEY